MNPSFTKYPITTDFQQTDNFHPNPHTGVDFASPVGTPIEIPTDGVIQKIQNDPLLGNCIFVNLDNGVQMVVGHLSRIDVTYQQHVKAGQEIALSGGAVGSPGAGHTTGPHVHITMRKISDGSLVNPLQYIKVGKHEAVSGIVEPVFVLLALLVLLSAPLGRKRAFSSIGLIAVLFFLINFWMGR